MMISDDPLLRTLIVIALALGISGFVLGLCLLWHLTSDACRIASRNDHDGRNNKSA
jgi:hypothetical protein